MHRRFEFVDEGSSKFWTIRAEGIELTTTFGRIGTAGKVATKSFGDATACAAEAERLVRSKLAKGYVEVQAPGFGRDDLWSLVDRARHGSEGDPDLLAERLREALVERPVEDILAFARHFDELREQARTGTMWAAAYVLNEGCSDDGFEDFLGWLVSRGRATFEAAVASPDDLVRFAREDDLGMCSNESVLYAAQEAHEERTGASLPDTGVARGEVELDWEEDRESLQRVVPRLVARFWPA